MASLSGKVETDVEVKAPPEKLDILFTKPPQPSQSSTTLHLQSCEGDWAKEGSVLCWKYTYGGEAKVLKEKILAVDRANKTMTMKVIDGDILKEYKNLVFSIGIRPKSGGDGSIVRWGVEYEKQHEGASPPEGFLQFGAQICKEVEACIA